MDISVISIGNSKGIRLPKTLIEKYNIKDTMELVDAILFQNQKQPKENHPHGWYRKFDKKRF